MNFKHVYLFLVLSGTFYWKFILNINHEHAQDYSCPGATFAFCSHREKLPQQGGLSGVVQRESASRSCSGATKKSCEQLQASEKLTSGSVSSPGAMSCPGIM